MKVRLTTDHIRIRIAADEVAELESGNELVCPLRALGMATRLGVTPDQQPQVSAARDLVVLLPSEWIEGWASSNEVGFDFDVLDPDQPGLRVVVEKDYPCEHGPDGQSIVPKPKRMTP